MSVGPTFTRQAPIAGTVLIQPDPDRLYDRNFLLAMASQTCFVIANTLMAHYARWIEFLGGDLRQVGSIMGLGAFLGLLLRPWLAQWINRLGARTMWVVGYGVFAASSIANLMLIEIGPMIYILRSSLFVGTAIVFTSGLTYISQTAPDHRRVEAIGIFGIGGFLGMLIGPFLGDLFLSQREWNNFAVLFVVAAIANILPAIGLFFLRPTDSEGTNSSLRLREFVKVARWHWPGMILLVDLTFGVCMSGPFIFVASFVDGAALQTGRVSVIGLFFLCYAGMGITVRLSSRRLPDRIGARKVLLVGMLFMAAGMLCFGLVSAAAFMADRDSCVAGRRWPWTDVSHDDFVDAGGISERGSRYRIGAGADDAGCRNTHRRTDLRTDWRAVRIRGFIRLDRRTVCGHCGRLRCDVAPRRCGRGNYAGESAARCADPGADAFELAAVAWAHRNGDGWIVRATTGRVERQRICTVSPRIEARGTWLWLPSAAVFSYHTAAGSRSHGGVAASVASFHRQTRTCANNTNAVARALCLSLAYTSHSP